MINKVYTILDLYNLLHIYKLLAMKPHVKNAMISRTIYVFYMHYELAYCFNKSLLQIWFYKDIIYINRNFPKIGCKFGVY